VAGNNCGFTLVEMAVALFIIALLLGSILVPLTAQVEQRQIADTQKKQDEAKEALIGFALANGYLPCPAISATNGQEDRTAGTCTGGKRDGYLPWDTLGISRLDAWGRIYRYSVTPAFANSNSASLFKVTTSTDITVRTRDGGGALTVLASNVPAIVVAHGKNGYGAVDNLGAALALPSGWPAANTDENSNATSTTSFVSRSPQAEGASGTGGEFDDVVTWVPLYLLLNRMIAAGKLP